jgi:hypothetical protein
MNQLLSKFSGSLLVVILALLAPLNGTGQTRFLAQASPEQRLPRLWQYCSDHLISDWDSTASHQFLRAVATTADSLGDEKLKKYAQYFQKCYRLLFSARYEQYFPTGDYRSVVALLARTKAWAQENSYPDIAAACDHHTGGVYFQVGRYGAAFEHLLQAHKAFQEIGYEHVPNASGYLFYLGLCYYRFEETDKALASFLAATRYPFYVPRTKINTLNTIGLIYVRRKAWRKAMVYYRKTIAQAAAFHDKVWVGIGLGNLGQALLAQGQNDSALFYLRRSYQITSIISNGAPEDAAYTSLGLATAFIGQQQPDSAQYYLRMSQQLARAHIRDSTQSLEYRLRMLNVLVKLNRETGNYATALRLSDSLSLVKDSLRHVVDARIVNRAVEKAEAERYQAELNLLTSQKNLNRLRFYVLLSTLLGIIIAGALLFNQFRRRKKRQFALTEKEKELLAAEKKLAEEKWQYAEELLAAYLQTLKDKTHLIDSLTTELQHLKENNQQANLSPIASRIEQLVSSTILTEEDWQQFRILFDQAYPGFVFRLKEKLPDLSPAETRLLILTRLKLSPREMAQTLGISIDAIRKAHYRIRKKFNLEEATLDVLLQNASV